MRQLRMKLIQRVARLLFVLTIFALMSLSLIFK